MLSADDLLRKTTKPPTPSLKTKAKELLQLLYTSKKEETTTQTNRKKELENFKQRIDKTDTLLAKGTELNKLFQEALEISDTHKENKISTEERSKKMEHIIQELKRNGINN